MTATTPAMLDMLMLEELEVPPPREPALMVEDSPASRMRARHHGLARLIAEGKSYREASYIMGFSSSRVNILAQDPAFRELVAYYKETVAQQYHDMHGKLADLAGTAAEILQERLEEKPTAFTNGELLKIISDTCDRSIAPSKAQGPAIKINIGFVESTNAGTKPEPQVLDLQAEHKP